MGNTIWEVGHPSSRNLLRQSRQGLLWLPSTDAQTFRPCTCIDLYGSITWQRDSLRRLQYADRGHHTSGTGVLTLAQRTSYSYGNDG